jgi:hypothetical protein
MSFFHKSSFPQINCETKSLLKMVSSNTKKNREVKTIKFGEEYKNKKARGLISNSNSIEFRELFQTLCPLDKTPSLILSILGPNNNFPISIRQKNAFKKGLIEIIESKKDTLIITGIIFCYI